MPTIQFKGKNIIWNQYLAVPYHTLDKVNQLNFVSPKAKDKGNQTIKATEKKVNNLKRNIK